MQQGAEAKENTARALRIEDLVLDPGGMAQGQPSPPVDWETTFGGAASEIAKALQRTHDGGYLLAGSTTSGSSGGPGDRDVYLVKISAEGEKLWEIVIGSPEASEEVSSLRQTRDGSIVLAGSTRPVETGGYTTYLVKTDRLGAVIWSRTFPHGKGGHCVQETSDGGYIVAGGSRLVAGVARVDDVHLLKTDSDGKQQWEKFFGGEEFDSGVSVSETRDHGYVVAGYTRSFGEGSRALYVIKTDAAGDTLWHRTLHGEGCARGYSVVQMVEENHEYFVVAGETAPAFEEPSDVYVIKVRSNGELVWERTFGGVDSDRGLDVQEADDGGYIVAGSTRSFGAGIWDFYFLKIDRPGELVWSRTCGGEEIDYCHAVQQAHDGGYLAGGTTYSFGSGQNDMYLVKLTP
jgi:hypothetical protein